MNILLLNTNPVVSRLISLCMRDDEIMLEEVTDVSQVKRDRYDVVFVDDASYVPEAANAVKELMVQKRVYLCGKENLDAHFEGFDTVIQKPFLPSQIIAVIESVKEMEEETADDTAFIFPLSTEETEDEVLPVLEEDERDDEKMQVEDDVEASEEEEESMPLSPEVLDSNEIERIKALLEEDDEDLLEIDDPDMDYETRKVEVITEHLEADGLEIVLEDEIADILSQKAEESEKILQQEKASKEEKASKKEKSSKKKKKKGAKKSKKEKEESYTFEEALIAAIEGMKPKKIKKLLKDAEVSIKISFKDKK